MNVQIPCRNDPEIKKLYNGRVCTEISVETGGFCTGDQNCVLPNTPGNISSVCPNQDQVDNIFRSRIQTRKRKRAFYSLPFTTRKKEEERLSLVGLNNSQPAISCHEKSSGREGKTPVQFCSLTTIEIERK